MLSNWLEKPLHRIRALKPTGTEGGETSLLFAPPLKMAHGLFSKRVLDTVLDAMTDNGKMSLDVLDYETNSRAFALVILKMLTQQAGQGKSGAAV